MPVGRRPGQDRALRDAFGLRCRHRLQGRRHRAGAGCSLPGRGDVYFDNTAGAISDAVLGRLAIGAQVVNLRHRFGWRTGIRRRSGPRVERHLLVKARPDVRFSGVRLTTSLRGSGRPSGRMGARRPNSLSRGHRRWHRTLPGAIAELYRGVESRQAADPPSPGMIRGSLIAVDARRRKSPVRI